MWTIRKNITKCCCYADCSTQNSAAVFTEQDNLKMFLSVVQYISKTVMQGSVAYFAYRPSTAELSLAACYLVFHALTSLAATIIQASYACDRDAWPTLSNHCLCVCLRLRSSSLGELSAVTTDRFVIASLNLPLNWTISHIQSELLSSFYVSGDIRDTQHYSEVCKWLTCTRI